MNERTSPVLLRDVMDRFGDLGGRVRDRLHAQRLRATPARIAVMAALTDAPGVDRRDLAPAATTRAVPGHLTVLGLQRAVAALGVPLDGATVYRTVTTLQELGLVHHVAIRDRAARYGLSDPAHHHAICTECGTLRSVPAQQLGHLLDAAAGLADLAPQECGALTLHGRCAACRSGAARPARPAGAPVRRDG
ncbi:transcriptional repressor [Streptomyces sp. NPDC047002]|uniref:Fur family transcriptional regulator n=1 Tax=Streptomyces sp. NPDC047002 TaxID=3155475 RepID=UPI0034514D7A